MCEIREGEQMETVLHILTWRTAMFFQEFLKANTKIRLQKSENQMLCVTGYSRYRLVGPVLY